MTDKQALRILLRACEETLEAARADGAWYGDSVRNHLCQRLKAELDADEGSVPRPSPT